MHTLLTNAEYCILYSRYKYSLSFGCFFLYWTAFLQSISSCLDGPTLLGIRGNAFYKRRLQKLKSMDFTQIRSFYTWLSVRFFGCLLVHCSVQSRGMIFSSTYIISELNDKASLSSVVYFGLSTSDESEKG